VWATFQEIENFYNRDKERFKCWRGFLGPSVPTEILRDVCGDCAFVCPSGVSDAFWHSVRGKFIATIDQRLVGDAIREFFQPDLPADAKFCIVTDQELTPPPDFRYIIWDDCAQDPSEGGIASLAPLDPRHWRIKDPDRLATIKRRVRTACISITGECLGFKRCENPRCFLYLYVDATEPLDEMALLGPEHPGLESLFGSSFTVDGGSPEQVQDVILDPESNDAIEEAK
jgi:hypothetical protein